MPLYEYRCEKCGEQIEVQRKMSDPLLTVHAQAFIETVCDGKLEQLLSAPGLQFKGTGWYVTDYSKSK